MITLTTPEFSMPNFDTHKFVKSFVTAKTEEEKAEAIVRVITEAKSDTQIEIKETKNDFDSKIDLLATKNDLENFRLATKADLKLVKEELRGEIKSLEIRMKDGFDAITTKFYLALGGVAVFLTGIILGILPMLTK